MTASVEQLPFVPCLVDPSVDCSDECDLRDRMIENIKKVAEKREISPAEVVLSIRKIVREDASRKIDNMMLAALGDQMSMCAHKDDFPIASIIF